MDDPFFGAVTSEVLSSTLAPQLCLSEESPAGGHSHTTEVCKYGRGSTVFAIMSIGSASVLLLAKYTTSNYRWGVADTFLQWHREQD